MIKARVRLENMDAFDASIDEVRRAVDEYGIEPAADIVKEEADATAEFADKTGKLRKGNKKRKSKFEDGGFIVYNRQPHAHLVEFGHVMLDKAGDPTKLKRVPAHPFMRRALEKSIARIVTLIRGIQ